jgi:hypothetical protein
MLTEWVKNNEFVIFWMFLNAKMSNIKRKERVQVLEHVNQVLPINDPFVAVRVQLISEKDH